MSTHENIVSQRWLKKGLGNYIIPINTNQEAKLKISVEGVEMTYHDGEESTTIFQSDSMSSAEFYENTLNLFNLALRNDKILNHSLKHISSKIYRNLPNRKQKTNKFTTNFSKIREREIEIAEQFNVPTHLIQSSVETKLRHVAENTKEDEYFNVKFEGYIVPRGVVGEITPPMFKEISLGTLYDKVIETLKCEGWVTSTTNFNYFSSKDTVVEVIKIGKGFDEWYPDQHVHVKMSMHPFKDVRVKCLSDLIKFLVKHKLLHFFDGGGNSEFYKNVGEDVGVTQNTDGTVIDYGDSKLEDFMNDYAVEAAKTDSPSITTIELPSTKNPEYFAVSPITF